MFEYKIRPHSLVMEITERCNMQCEHCLRGCARNVDMTREIVNKTLDAVESIDTLTFTGGEPTLNMDIIEYVFDEIRRRNIYVGAFWMATNGKINSLELATLILRNLDLFEEIDMCGLTISVDDYHDEVSKYNPLRMLSIYSGDYDNPENRKLINRGNAKENGIGELERVVQKNFYLDVYEDLVDFDLLYVRANGDCLADCDCSYEMMDELSLCKIENLHSYITDVIASEKKEAS